MERPLPIILLVLVLLIVLIWLFCSRDSRPPITLMDAAGTETSEFQLHDSLVFEAQGLTPRTHYDVEIVDDAGDVVIANRLSTDQQGRIPGTVLWYAIGSEPCWAGTMVSAAATGPLSYARVTDVSTAGRSYVLNIADQGEVVLSTTLQVAETLLRPVLYTADARGCPKTGFLIGEEDVWVVGRNFPAGSLARLWVVAADSDWQDGDPLNDETGQHGYDLPPLLELESDETTFSRLLWPRGLTSVGSYDVAAEVVSYPFGAYRVSPVASAQNVVAHRSHSGFVVQRRPGVAEPLEVDIAGAVSSPFTFRSTFLTTENVFVGVDPALQPGYIGQTAKVYIVDDKTDAQWTTDTSLSDVTGGPETITVNGICGNCWKTLAWAAPLTVGEYDVVLDFNQDGAYTPGTDLIDSLDPVGFTVSEVRVDRISFNFAGSGAVALHDHLAAAPVSAPEYLSAGQLVKPAAWVKGGTHTVRVRFAAVPALSSAQIWAEGGVGGLASGASPVTVSFSGGTGQADFNVNSPPGSVAKSTFSWSWKYKNGGSTAEMGATGQHLLYTVLATPVAPQATPWVQALDVACAAAHGETTAAGATRAIWGEFYANAGGQYDTYSGSPRYTGGWGQPFDLTKWLTNYATASIGTVNCYDMGKAVVVFANALGAPAEYVYTSPFGLLNLVKPIGKGWANNPFYDNPGCNANAVVPGNWGGAQGRCGFGNHAFSRLAGQLFDGSGGQVDIDAAPDSLPAGNPWELDGDDSWTASYRDRVIDDVPPSNPGSPTVYSFVVN